MQMNPVGWFEIYVDDMVRAKTFYEAVFKVTLEKLDNETGIDSEMWVFPSDMDKYGATGALCSMPEVKAETALWCIALVMIVRQKQAWRWRMVVFYKYLKWRLDSPRS